MAIFAARAHQVVKAQVQHPGRVTDHLFVVSESPGDLVLLGIDFSSKAGFVVDMDGPSIWIQHQKSDLPPEGRVMIEKDILASAPSVDGTVATLQMLQERVIPPHSMAFVSCMVIWIPRVHKCHHLGHVVTPQAPHHIDPLLLTNTVCQIHPTKA